LYDIMKVVVVFLEISIAVEQLVACLAGVVVLHYMVPQFVLILEIVSTLRAGVVIGALAVMRFEASFRSEDPVMRATIPMLGLHVLNPRLLEFEETIAFPAIVVMATLHVMFSLCIGAPKVDVAVIANPVGIGIVFVLLQGSIVSKRLLTANTVCHRTIEGGRGPSPK